MAGHSRPLALLALAASVCLLGCAAGGHPRRASSSLVAGKRAGPLGVARLAPAARLAERFARAYAHSAYLSHPPRLPGESETVRRDVLAAASRVPATRHGEESRAGAIRLQPLSPSALRAGVVVEDRRAPSFSVGFTLARRGGRWRVVAISTPE